MKTPLPRFAFGVVCALMLGSGSGCKNDSKPDQKSAAVANSSDADDQSVSDKQQVGSQTESNDQSPTEPVDETFEIQAYEASEAELLAARLPEEQASKGWIRLFDGHTLFGWEITNQANWRIEDGSIVVDRGNPGLMCTSIPWLNYEIKLQFKATSKTNSGLFLRTPLEPTDPAADCYEINIAPNDNPFPTGSIVKRKKADQDGNKKFDAWRELRVSCNQGKVRVGVDGIVTCDYFDTEPLGPGRIGLQFNSGRIEFKDIQLRPLGLNSLLDGELSQWKKYPEMPGTFTVTEEGAMRVQGGRTQIETKASFGDFVLRAEYKLPTAEMNSGIFFRCIPGDVMMGYECQLSNETVDGSAVMPADVGTGGIFKRQNARVVAGEPDKWATVILVANQDKIASWVNGVQVADWVDDRKADENPRRGKRIEPGTIMIQGHDPGTDAFLKQIAIVSIPSKD